MAEEEKEWHEKTIREQTLGFIQYIEAKYYKDYLRESERYERLNFRAHMLIVVLGFSVTIIFGIKKIFDFRDLWMLNVFDLATLILPSVSSVAMLYISQRGYKKKEEIRENARIECKYLLNEARIRFGTCHGDPDYLNLYRWLNIEIKGLQLLQASAYFQSESKMLLKE
ncbi:MAG: hypothetical protein NT040_18335 [Bacteroidetes bacterium]|nr:hypothetical protein [Bacteroidota bacterium]